jgi:hypothetical protein
VCMPDARLCFDPTKKQIGHEYQIHTRYVGKQGKVSYGRRGILQVARRSSPRWALSDDPWSSRVRLYRATVPASILVLVNSDSASPSLPGQAS